VAVIPQPREIHDVQRNRSAGNVREQDHSQSIGEAVLGDALDGGDFGNRGWLGSGSDGENQQYR
jgi:hypothetical protein